MKLEKVYEFKEKNEIIIFDDWFLCQWEIYLLFDFFASFSEFLSSWIRQIIIPSHFFFKLDTKILTNKYNNKSTNDTFCHVHK